MYFNGVNRMSQAIGRVTFGLYHAFSRNGTDWKVTPATPVLNTGPPGLLGRGQPGRGRRAQGRPSVQDVVGGYVDRLQQEEPAMRESSDGFVGASRTWACAVRGRQTNICFSLQPGLNSNEYELPVDLIRDEAAPPDRRYLMFLHTQGPTASLRTVPLRPTAGSSCARPTTPATMLRRGSSQQHPPCRRVVLKEDSYWWAFVDTTSPTEEVIACGSPVGRPSRRRRRISDSAVDFPPHPARTRWSALGAGGAPDFLCSGGRKRVVGLLQFRRQHRAGQGGPSPPLRSGPGSRPGVRGDDFVAAETSGADMGPAIGSRQRQRALGGRAPPSRAAGWSAPVPPGRLWHGAVGGHRAGRLRGALALADRGRAASGSVRAAAGAVENDPGPGDAPASRSPCAGRRRPLMLLAPKLRDCDSITAQCSSNPPSPD